MGKIKKYKSKQTKAKLEEIENTKEDITDKIYIPGIGYKQDKKKVKKDIPEKQSVTNKECNCKIDSKDDWKEKIKETNKEEQVIENVTYMVKVETDQVKRLQNLVNKVESGMKKNSKIGLIKQSDP